MKKHTMFVVLLAVIVACLGMKADRRPIGMIYTGPGGTGWTPEQITNIVGRQVKERPWKRYCDHMPASWAPAQDMSGAQWFTLTREQRSAFRAINKLANSMGRKFYIYGGILMGSPMELQQANPQHINDFFSPADHYAMWELVIKPWRADSLDGWIFDAGSAPQCRRSSLAWCRWLSEEHGMWAAIEAFPLTPQDTIDVKVALQVPCVARADFNPAAPILVAPEGSEMHVWALAVPKPGGGWQTTMTVAQAIDWLKRGFIVDPDEPHDLIVLEAMKAVGIQP